MASPAGRGAQVILDGTAQAAARGAVAHDMDANVIAKRGLELAGTAPDGTTPDGSTSTGIAAKDGVLAAGPVLNQADIGAAFQAWFNSLPTTLPASAGVFWNNGGTLALS